MIDKYKIRENDDGKYVLIDHQENEVYEWDDGYAWPDEDALKAAIDEANLGNPQKAFFATMFLGPAPPEDE